jgi:general secretion pathway protein A
VTGEIGTGKTTMCRKLLRLADSKTKFAFILNPNFSEIDLLKLIIEDLGLSTKNYNHKLGLIKILNDYLLSESTLGNNIVLVIDEAQNMSIRQLEQIRLLSNLETEKEKLLQIVLVGQPELQDKLRLPELRQLRQRVAIHFHLQPLPKTDIKHYIEDRISRAAHRPYVRHELNFTTRAIDAIFKYTKGTPRTINILCDRA